MTVDMNVGASTTGIMFRLALYGNEVARLPIACPGVTAGEGLAWVTVQGQDRILRAGDSATFLPDRFGAVVTALGHTPLILEVLGGERRRAALLRPARGSGLVVCQEATP